MGNFREQTRNGINETRENSRKAQELGGKMGSEARGIKGVLESIQLQDNEDVQAIQETGRAYQSSFDGAFSEQVETAGQEVQTQSEQIQNETNAELGNVQNGIQALEQARGMSEVGQDAAGQGRQSLESSAQEYQGLIQESQNVVQETQQAVQQLKGDISGIF